jgi:hypothetical protein
LISGQVHYFQSHVLLNAHRFIAENNVLGLGPEAEGVLGRYTTPGATVETPGTPYALLVVKYPSGKRARQALRAFVESCLPYADSEGFGQTKKGLWIGVRTDGKYLITVLDAPSRDVASQGVTAVVRLRESAQSALGSA